jgi:hypothetical protein
MRDLHLHAGHGTAAGVDEHPADVAVDGQVEEEAGSVAGERRLRHRVAADAVAR